MKTGWENLGQHTAVDTSTTPECARTSGLGARGLDLQPSNVSVSANPKLPEPVPPMLERKGSEPPANKPMVVGVYGIQGSGKSHLLSELKKSLDPDSFCFFDGSATLRRFTPGRFEQFNSLPEAEKYQAREKAIEAVSQERSDSEVVGIVAGHYTLWGEDDEGPDLVWTASDQKIFTHMVYLQVSPDINLRIWQDREISELRSTCYKNGILFTVINEHSTRNGDDNGFFAADNTHSQAKKILEGRCAHAEDTGMMFWERFPCTDPHSDIAYRLKAIFGGPLGYTYDAFLQAMLLYQELDSKTFHDLCRHVANEVALYPEFLSLLRRVEQDRSAGAVVVTCGLKQLWEYILSKHGLMIEVIGGGRMEDEYVVTGEVKAALVHRLRKEHGMSVWAFGDSELDLKMMQVADQAIVVVGTQGTRSKTMDKKLALAMESGLVARQALVPAHAAARLDAKNLPLVDLNDTKFINLMLRRRKHVSVRYPSKNAAMLLQTPMRDAEKAGPVLQDVHRRVGWFLAMELVTDLLGTETYRIPHVQGNLSDGHRLKHEEQTVIVALMRGGEPMAQGINDAFPLAMFVHANEPQDLEFDHLEGRRTALLVDSVINRGTTIVEFVRRIPQLHSTVPIIVVAGVVQKEAIAGPLEFLDGQIGPKLVTLRISDNKFTGRKGTDTGNRLFNTTHLK
ncbi:uncharacterized protein L3040_000045 [Drepanopeziza brunnea f. sp. 'multigermtubi']|uniref:uncharacterized protein n=1 Tax=Drepanopeziza brunnea f. sp. 'multigermtubi' TaxID=698441 RepID=UPI00238E9989|nr:hypothetical protein L3040_000045 [Drepanopeziza brunnea f. sp. 'multigermtubi']